MQDGEKSLWQVDDRNGLGKKIGRKEGNFGSQKAILSKTIVPTRSLRVMIKSRAPPPPIRNKATSQFISACSSSSSSYCLLMLMYSGCVCRFCMNFMFSSCCLTCKSIWSLICFCNKLVE